MSGLVRTGGERALVAALGRLGWEARAIEIDVSTGQAVLELERADGRWLHVACDRHGRASVERWSRAIVTERGKGRVPWVDRCKDTFLGRERHDGILDALRGACEYVAENPAPGRERLPASLVFALLTGGAHERGSIK